MQDTIANTIFSHIHSGMAVGLVGLGPKGTALRATLETMHPAIRLLLCDPAAADAEADDLSGEFFALWGNGMGGCQLTGEELEAPLLPPDRLAAAADAVILCPLVDSQDDAADFPREAKLLETILANAGPQKPLILSTIPADKLFPGGSQPPCTILFL